MVLLTIFGLSLTILVHLTAGSAIDILKHAGNAITLQRGKSGTWKQWKGE